MRHIVIFGAGVIGVACAEWLQRAGWRVTLVDKGRVGGACSHGNCGYVCPSHVLPLAAPGAVASTLKTALRRNSPLKIGVREVLRNAGWFRRFAGRCNERDLHAAAAGIQPLLDGSRGEYERLIAEHHLDCDWQPTGLLFVYRTPQGFEHYHAINDMLAEKYHRPAQRFSAAELVEKEPALHRDAVSGAYWYDGDAQLRPDRLMTAWRKRLHSLGVEVVENCELQRFDGSTAVTTQGAMPADAYVIAAGAWTAKLGAMLGVRVPILPGKGYSLTMTRPTICPTTPMIFEEDRVAVSPFADGLRIGSMMEFVGFNDTINPKRLKLLTDTAKRYLRDCDGTMQETWTGWRPMIYDGKPVIDFVPRRPNVLVAGGHGMLGLSMAPATGQLAAAMLSGTATAIDPAHYSLTRFA